jgi:hypothetical protein
MRPKDIEKQPHSSYVRDRFGIASLCLTTGRRT